MWGCRGPVIACQSTSLDHGRAPRARRDVQEGVSGARRSSWSRVPRINDNCPAFAFAPTTCRVGIHHRHALRKGNAPRRQRDRTQKKGLLIALNMEAIALTGNFNGLRNTRPEPDVGRPASALSSMNSRRGSTSPPMKRTKSWSASMDFDHQLSQRLWTLHSWTHLNAPPLLQVNPIGCLCLARFEHLTYPRHLGWVRHR